MTAREPNDKRPNFFIVGAPKCGTTALSEYLRAHRRVFMCDPKEPNFFNRDFNYFHSGDPDSLDDYLRLFEGIELHHEAIGEASVWYLYSTVAAERIRVFRPDARIIAMVRNPIELVSSLHSQLLYTLDEDVPVLKDAWELQRARRESRAIPPTCRQPAFLQYAAVASLSEQIRRFLAHFPEQSVRVVVYDDFRRDPGAVYRSTLDFLGLVDDGRTDFSRVNASKEHRSAGISRFTQRPPATMMRAAVGLKRMLGIERLGILERLRALNRKPRQRPPIEPAFLEELREAFKPEVASLSALLDRDLSHWLEQEVR